MTATARTDGETTAWANDTCDSVISADGTRIGYRQLGHGPGVVLVHGGMESSRDYRQLAEALADTFTVHIPDRRGRGLSGPHGEQYGMQREVEDLDAILSKTGAAYLFGVSSGALIVLRAGRDLPAVRKVAAYEPPVYEPLEGRQWADLVARYDREIATGELARALVTVVKGLQVGPPFFKLIPRPLLELLVKKMLAGEEREATGDDVTLAALVPTIHYDFQLEGNTEDFKGIPADVLLLGGSKSPAYLKRSLDTLGTLLPQARRIEFSGFNHTSASNAGQGEQQEHVAHTLRHFFAQ